MGEVISLAAERDRRQVAPVAGRPSGQPSSQPSGRLTGPRSDPPASVTRTGEPLWREVVGDALRQERRRQRRTLADVAGRAGMSAQHLSEVERGRKEASSERLSAATGALGLSLAELARRCAGTLARAGAPTGPVLLAA